jgi:hypothetical protein
VTVDAPPCYDDSMTRVHAFALGLACLACTATQNPPDAKPDAKADKKPPVDRACTEMACRDAATIDTKLTAAGAPLGKHEFALEVDGVAQTCTVEFTVVTELDYTDCSGGASVWFGPVMRGVEAEIEVEGQKSVVHTEEPVPGQFKWQLSLPGTPAKAHVVHSHAGKVLLDQTAEFGSYGDYRPNGEGCEPVCKLASVEWTGP